MRKINLILIIVCSAVAIFAALDEKEIAVLRKQLNIPAKEIVRENKDVNFSDKSSLKIFLSIKRNGSEAKYFDKWVKEWNKNDAQKHGALETVDEISQADVVITQFVTTQPEYVREAGVSVGNIPEKPGQPNSKVRVKTENDYNRLKLPVFSYLLVREDDLWTIVYRNVETSLPGEQLYNPDLRLWEKFKEKMKER